MQLGEKKECHTMAWRAQQERFSPCPHVYHRVSNRRQCDLAVYARQINKSDVMMLSAGSAGTPAPGASTCAEAASRGGSVES